MYSDLLVGSTGFVGGNLMAKHRFSAVCHSSDVAAQYNTRPDLCVYAGVPAAMFLANADPEADLAVMAAARENLRRIAPKEVVLISSIAVYADSRGNRGYTGAPMAGGGDAQPVGLLGGLLLLPGGGGVFLFLAHGISSSLGGNWLFFPNIFVRLSAK